MNVLIYLFVYYKYSDVPNVWLIFQKISHLYLHYLFVCVIMVYNVL